MQYSKEDRQKAVDELCKRIEQGDSVRRALSYDDLPDRNTFYRWFDEFEPLRDQYARACEVREDKFFDDILEISDTDNADITINEGMAVVDGQAIQRSKLRIDTRKWMLSKMNPKKYGDRIQQDISGELKSEVVIIELPDNGRDKKD